MENANVHTADVLALLQSCGVTHIHHCAPLHYFPFIARSAALFSKDRLIDAGFARQHFRSTSSAADVARGFARYVHLTVYEDPPILRAKLAAGFPHFAITIPIDVLRTVTFDLCRFNIARARYFRGAKQSLSESDANGRYYDDLALPIARTASEKMSLFAANFGKTMIEVLVQEKIDLPVEARFRFFAHEDAELARRISVQVAAGRNLDIEVQGAPGYNARPDYRNRVNEFVDAALADSGWKGNGLNFDRV